MAPLDIRPNVNRIEWADSIQASSSRNCAESIHLPFYRPAPVDVVYKLPSSFCATALLFTDVCHGHSGPSRFRILACPVEHVCVTDLRSEQKRRKKNIGTNPDCTWTCNIFLATTQPIGWVALVAPSRRLFQLTCNEHPKSLRRIVMLLPNLVQKAS